MCQLTYVNTLDPKLSALIAYSLVFVDSETNKDGVGFATSSGTWKTRYGANVCTNVFPNLKKIVPKDNGMILAHTRAAGLSFNNVKTIVDENAHPFVGKRFVLMHNGTLTYIAGHSKEEKDALVGMTDSEFFLNKLEAEAETTEDFVTCINNTMKLFYGKFAFLIRDTLTNRNYAIRGNSALLHRVPLLNKDGQPCGFVINTVKNDLVHGLVLAMNMSGGHFDFDDKEIQELKRDTIFDVTDPLEVKEVATCKENFYTTATQSGTQKSTATGTGYGSRYNSAGYLNSGYQSEYAETEKRSSSITSSKPVYSPFVTRMLELKLTLTQIDKLIRRIFVGKSFLTLTENEWKTLDTEYLPMFESSIVPQSVELWRDLLPYISNLGDRIYSEGVVSFPYFLEEPLVLDLLLKELKEKEENTNARKSEKAGDLHIDGSVCDAVSTCTS
jgi:predicted glutamine amidotransferase